MKNYISIAGAILFTLTGCIKETLPTGYVLASQIAESETALEGMMNAVYSTLAGTDPIDDGTMPYGGMKVMLDHGTSSLLNPGYNGYNTMLQYTYGNFSYSNRARWPVALYYTYIKSVNDIIGILEGSEELSDTEKGYLGQCYAFRALYYSEITQIMEWKEPTDKVITPKLNMPTNDLANLGVPIVTESTDAETASNNPRVTVDENFDLVLSDLAKAEEYLADFTRSDVTEPDLAVVYGLYARAYLFLASRASTLAAKYTNESELWRLAYDYADLAISTSGCTMLTEDEFLDPVNGFNNKNSQNSWMLCYSVSSSNSAAVQTDWNPADIMGSETDYIVYGWRVGRSLARHWYERLSNDDWRKKCWIDPNFFYESKNQVDGGEYLVERDSEGNLINNKWTDDYLSTEQSDWSDEYNGRLCDGYTYTLNSSPSWVRSRLSYSNGFVCFPWIYINLKFRPRSGAYNDVNTGGAIDWCMMRVEEMYFIRAEAALHTSGLAASKALLEEIMLTRNPKYTCDATDTDDYMEEFIFQKDIEFWGEGVNYFDDKRLSRGLYRAYRGTSVTRVQQLINCDGIFPGWTPMFSQSEMNANKAITDYNTPSQSYANYQYWTDLTEASDYYGAELDLSALNF